MNILDRAAAWIKSEWAKITGDATVVTNTIENIAVIANGVVNNLKNWIATPAGQTIEAIISQVPGIGPYATDVINWLPTLMVDLGWAQNEFTKSPAQVLTDGVTYAVNAANPNVKASNLIVLQGHITTKVSSLAKTPATIQTAISIAPTVYAAPATVSPD